MTTMEIEWHASKDGLPPESCECLTHMNKHEHDVLIIADYSAKHKKFNCHDFEDEPEYGFDVDYWARIPADFDWGRVS